MKWWNMSSTLPPSKTRFMTENTHSSLLHVLLLTSPLRWSPASTVGSVRISKEAKAATTLTCRVLTTSSSDKHSSAGTSEGKEGGQVTDCQLLRRALVHSVSGLITSKYGVNILNCCLTKTGIEYRNADRGWI